MFAPDAFVRVEIAVTDQSYRPSDRRQSLRLAIDHRSNLRVTLDGSTAGGQAIQHVTLTDISRGGLMASDAGQLVPGAHVTLEIPLIGWREAQVMSLVGEGLTSPEIGRRLYLSVRTVDMHVRNSVAKLGCRTRAEAVRRLASRSASP